MAFGRFLDVLRAFERTGVDYIRVATPAMPVEMKRGTIRPIDRADAEALAKLFRIEGI